MSITYLTIILLLIIINGLRYWRKVDKQPSASRWMYRVVYLLSLALYLSILLHIQIPMPTQFFIHNISPWVIDFINR